MKTEFKRFFSLINFKYVYYFKVSEDKKRIKNLFLFIMSMFRLNTY